MYSSPLTATGALVFVHKWCQITQEEDLAFKQQNYPLKADVYSYGITCAEILTGKPPYSEVRRVNHLSTIMKGVRPPLPIEYCPAHVANLINRCWDTDPCNRPSFSQICTELVDFQRFVFLCNLAEPNDFQRSYGVVDHLQSLRVEVKTEQAQLTDPKDEYSEQNIPSAAGASAQQPSSDQTGGSKSRESSSGKWRACQRCCWEQFKTNWRFLWSIHGRCECKWINWWTYWCSL